MTQKTALILSAVLTAFVLVVGGGLIARMSQSEAASAAAPIVAPSVSAPVNEVATQVQELLQQREAQYRQLIDQANQRLAAMNQQLAAAQAAQAAPAAPAAPAPTSSAAPQITLSPDAARDIAVQAANFATMIRTPELVRFEGKVAYEVGFTRGALYVDANTGAVLFNGTQGGGQPGAQAPASGGGHEHEVEHEEHDGEDHD